MKFTPDNATCRVFTFKEGLLSKIAHDLEIAVEKFELDIDAEASRARGQFDTGSLRVLHAMSEGSPNPTALSDTDKAKIGKQIQQEVLGSAQHPQATFQAAEVSEAPGGGWLVAGELTLHGVTRPVKAESKQAGSTQVCELTLHQPDFGITPYKAMMGTLKVQADVKVRLELGGG